MGLLKKNDYIKILNYYDITVLPTDSSKIIKSKAEKILAEKLCKCIKKVKDSYDETMSNSDAEESKAIGVCTDSIFRRKGLRHGKFTCKKTARLLRFPAQKYSLKKRSKYLSRKQKFRRMMMTRKR
jgi:hypothetical protein